MKFHNKHILVVITFGFCSILFILAFKNKRQHEYFDVLSHMMSQSIDINVLNNCYMSSVSRQLLNEPVEFRFVVYIDSTECTQCRLNHLIDYLPFSSLLNTRSGQMLVVIEPKAYDTNFVRNFIDEYSEFPCILAVDGSFAKANTFIPSCKAFHNFFINKNNEVILVGDPTTNSAVDELFQRRILCKNRKNTF